MGSFLGEIGANTVKRSIQKVLFRASVNYEELQTVINSRCLTYIYDDVLGRHLLSTFDDPLDDETDVDGTAIRKRMGYLKSLS